MPPARAGHLHGANKNLPQRRRLISLPTGPPGPGRMALFAAGTTGPLPLARGRALLRRRRTRARSNSARPLEEESDIFETGQQISFRLSRSAFISFPVATGSPPATAPRTAQCASTMSDAPELVTMGEAMGVDARAVVVDPAAPTRLIVRDFHGERPSTVVHNRAGRAGSRLTTEDVEPSLLAAAKVLHVTGITAALGGRAREALEHATDLARSRGVSVSSDPNYRSRLWASTGPSGVETDLLEGDDRVGGRRPPASRPGPRRTRGGQPTGNRR